VVSTTVFLLPEFLPDLVEDDAVVLSFNDLQIVVRTPRPRTLLWKDLRRDLRRLSRNELVAIANGEHTPQIVIGMNELGVFTRRAEDHDGVVAAGGSARFILLCHAMAPL